MYDSNKDRLNTIVLLLYQSDEPLEGLIDNTELREKYLIQ